MPYKIQNLSPSQNKSKLLAFNSCPGLDSLLWEQVIEGGTLGET